MSNEKMREEFEAWVKGQEDYFGCSSESLTRCYEDPDEYLCGAVHGAWLGWQASREALVIELPKAWQTNVGAMLTPNGVRFAIQEAGVKVKP
ncbi:hypothetical protein V2J79_05125 [Pseudomonas alliivorans]|nr:hypothetical protein [Pseudomonas alliivorans]